MDFDRYCQIDEIEEARVEKSDGWLPTLEELDQYFIGENSHFEKKKIIPFLIWLQKGILDPSKLSNEKKYVYLTISDFLNSQITD